MGLQAVTSCYFLLLMFCYHVTPYPARHDCCPLEGGVTCADLQHCCPASAPSCDGQRQMCLSEDGKVSPRV